MAKNETALNPSAAKSICAAAVVPIFECSEFKGSGNAKLSTASRVIRREQIAHRTHEVYAGRGYATGEPAVEWIKAGL